MRLLYIHLSTLSDRIANTLQVLNMCHAFHQIGVEVTLALPGNNSVAEMKNLIIKELGIAINFKIRQYRKYTFKGRPMSLGAYWGLKRILDKNKGRFDLCFVRNPFTLRLALNNGYNTVYEEHDETMHPIGFMNRFYIRRFLKDAKSSNLIKIVSISKALSKVLINRGIPKEKILVLHDGVNADGFAETKSRSEARQELGIHTTGKLVVYVGSLYKDRGIENILKLAASFPNCQFLVIGGPEEYKISWISETKNKRLTNILFKGHVPHPLVKSYLFAADILIILLTWNVPTINVCSPLKIFEYMAAGRIILGQKFPTIEEVLKNGKTAILANPDSYSDLEQKMAYALSLNYPNKMADRSRQLAIEKFSWKERAQTIVNEFKASC